MAKRQTRDELLKTIAHLQEQVMAHHLLLKSLQVEPTKGFHFVSSARGFSAYLIFVADDGSIGSFYSSLIGSEERKRRNSELYRMYEETPHLESFFRATEAETSFLSRFAPNVAPRA